MKEAIQSIRNRGFNGDVLPLIKLETKDTRMTAQIIAEKTGASSVKYHGHVNEGFGKSSDDPDLWVYIVNMPDKSKAIQLIELQG
jgi:hypothetical protein